MRRRDAGAKKVVVEECRYDTTGEAGGPACTTPTAQLGACFALAQDKAGHVLGPEPQAPILSQPQPYPPKPAEERDGSGAPPAPAAGPSGPTARHANEIADGVNGVFDSMFGYGPATFGNSYGAADSGPAVSRANDPYAWAQRLRDIPDGGWEGGVAVGPMHGAGGFWRPVLIMQLARCCGVWPALPSLRAALQPNPCPPLAAGAEDVLAELSLMGYTGDTGSVGRRGGGATRPGTCTCAVGSLSLMR